MSPGKSLSKALAILQLSEGDLASEPLNSALWLLAADYTSGRWPLEDLRKAVRIPLQALIEKEMFSMKGFK